jgi:hypothetical protein
MYPKYRNGRRNPPIGLEPLYSLLLDVDEAVAMFRQDVVIEKDRPSLLAGVRPQTYRIFVDGKLVQEQNGF